MRVTGPDTQQEHKQQRRRRYAAAAVCLGTLTATAIGTFVVKQHALGAQGAANARESAANPQQQQMQMQVSGQPVAYPFGPAGTIASTTQRPVPRRPISSGTAAPTAVGPTSGSTPRVPSPSAIGSAGGLGGVVGVGGDADSAAGAAQLFAAPASPGSVAAGAGAGAGAAAGAGAGAGMTVSNPLMGAAFAGLPHVGALFDYSNGASGSHFCTGSVVASQTGDIVITAAHCVYDSSSGVYVTGAAFVPGYHDGQQPYGIWTPSKILVPQQWIDSGDPDYDFAFLVVHQSGSAQRIQDLVGADRLGVNPSYTGLVQAVGYPDDTEQPITCTDYTKQFSDTQLEFDCGGYPGGTSGGPFLTDVDPETGQGTVVGVIGGYETGGDTPDTSYSAYFGNAAANLFSQAEAAG